MPVTFTRPSPQHRHPASHRFGSRRRPKPAPVIRRRACRRPTSSPRCSSPRCGSIRSDPQHPEADRFVLSKGHAAPILYAAWAAAGAFPREEVLKLRKIDSDLEGHPTPRLPFVDVATGSLGQGLCAGVGIALNARRIDSDYRTYVLLGDGEIGRGLGLGSGAGGGASQARQPVRDHRRQRPRPEPADAVASTTSRRCVRRWQRVRLARDRDRRPRHGGDARRALDEARGHEGPADDDRGADAQGEGRLALRRQGRLARQGAQEGRGDRPGDRRARGAAASRPTIAAAASSRSRAPRRSEGRCPISRAMAPAPAYKLGDSVATREATAPALAALGAIDARVVALDADVKNSTFSERFEKAYPDRFYQTFIAEQVMVGAAMGLASRGAIPFPSTFACFLERASDFIRMAGISTLERQARRLARGRVDRRRRPVADGAGGSGDVPRRAELHGALSVRRGERRAARWRWPRHARARSTCGTAARRRR